MITEAWRALGMAGRIIAGVVALVIVGVALWGVFRVVDAPRRAAEAKVDAKSATAYANAAQGAIDTIVVRNARTEEEREKIENGLEAIKALPPRDRYDASIGLLCALDSTADDPRCAELRKARAGGVEGRR